MVLERNIEEAGNSRAEGSHATESLSHRNFKRGSLNLLWNRRYAMQRPKVAWHAINLDSTCRMIV